MHICYMKTFSVEAFEENYIYYKLSSVNISKQGHLKSTHL